MGYIRSLGSRSVALSLLTVLLSLSPIHLQAETLVQDLFRDARYQEALELLHSQPQPENARYHYNLGTVHLKMGAFGISLAHLEKANRLQKHDPDIQHNLQIARTEMSKRVGDLDPSSAQLEKLADRISLDEVRATIGLLALLLSLLWLRAYSKARSIRRALPQPSSLLLLLALGITLFLYGAKRYAETHPPAILTLPQSVRSGPGDSYLELARLEAGIKVRVVDREGASEEASEDPRDPTEAGTAPARWLQVRFSPREIGWVRASSMLLL